jgi:hypothetical protein
MEGVEQYLKGSPPAIPLDQVVLQVQSKIFFSSFFLRWAGPRPHIPFPSRPHFLCKFCCHGDNLSLLRLGSPSITVLVFPDFADAYSRTTASYRLTRLFRPNTREYSQFLGASKLPLLE